MVVIGAMGWLFQKKKTNRRTGGGLIIRNFQGLVNGISWVDKKGGSCLGFNISELGV